jgi:hypothetical protein
MMLSYMCQEHRSYIAEVQIRVDDAVHSSDSIVA